MSTGVLFNQEHKRSDPLIGQTGSILPLDSHFRSLRRYIEDGKTTLDQLRVDFSVSQSNPGDPSRLQIAAKKLSGFFKTGKAPVSGDQTLEILAFMEAADRSKQLGGKPVPLPSYASQ